MTQHSKEQLIERRQSPGSVTTDHSSLHSQEDWGFRRHLHFVALIVATTAGVYLCYRMTVPFLPALSWALTLAVVFMPLQRWTESRVRSPSFASLLTVTAIVLAVFAPAIIIGRRLVRDATAGIAELQAKIESGEWRTALERRPQLRPLVEWMDGQNLSEMAASATNWMTSTGASLLMGSIVQVIGLLLTFYLLFYFLRDRRAVLQILHSFLPLTDAELDRLFCRVTETIHATIYGIFIVSAVQGLLGGLMFWWLGLPAPLLWGIVMGALALVPVLGAFVVWVPSAMFLALEGSWGKALMLTAWGLVVIGLIDNFLRPFLVGTCLKIHTVPLFISMVGGLILFGPAGMILGPIVLTATMTLLEIWPDRKSPEATVPPPTEDVSRFENEGGAVCGADNA
jgi:predicted PurR-regulated permease PerM